MAYVLVKLRWKSDTKSTDLIVANANTGALEFLEIAVGKEFHFRLTPRSLCIGTERDASGWLTCVENQRVKLLEETIRSVQGDAVLEKLTARQILKLEHKFSAEKYPELHQNLQKLKFNSPPGNQQCYYCNMKEYFACRKICIGDECRPSSSMAFDRCQPAETGVYLTKVGGQLKVGVSLNSDRRWLEQGSDFALELATLPGLEARAVEKRIAEELELKLQVRSKAKFENLNPAPQDDFEQELKDILGQSLAIAEEIKTIRGVEGIIHPQPEISDLTKFQGDLTGIGYFQEFSYLANDEFGGKIVGIKGSFIIVENNGYHFALDTKKLVGAVFELIPKATMKSQQSLDEFF